MEKIELEGRSKDELIAIIQEQEESIDNWMAIAQDIARTKHIVEKKYERLMAVVAVVSSLYILTLIVLIGRIIRNMCM
ncbi:MAG: hypothetical protein II407_05510 [Prevotella sp.]|nr:hypothetical protein [Prevotella sp.]